MKNFLLGVGMFFASNIAVGLECYTYKIFEGKSALQEDLQSFINPRFIEMMHAYPYLYKMDHRVVEFSWRIPQNMKLKGGVGKWVLREILYRHVPRSLS